MQPLSQPSLAHKVQEVQDAQTLSVRIGTMSQFNATSNQWTLAVGGVDILLGPAALTSYMPTLGDTVVVLKYGSQWIILGAVQQL